MKKDANIRQSNIELLRIISMSLIFLNHLSYHGGFFEHSTGINHHISCLFVCGGKFGVAIFVLISSYFMIDQKFKTSNTIALWLKTLLISLLAGLVLYLHSGNIMQFFKSAFPLYTAVFWFVPVYIVLLFISPFLNRLIYSISQKELKVLIIILMIPLAIVPMLKGEGDPFLGSGNLIWFIYLYLFGAFIKLYLDEKIIIKHKKLVLFLFGILYCLMFVAVDILGSSGLKYRSNGSIFLLLSSVMLFIYFSKCIKVFHNKTINVLGKASFMVYLLHDNQARLIIWKTVATEKYWNSIYMLPYSILMLILVFLIAIAVNKIVDLIIKQILQMSIIKKFSYKIDCIVNNTEL